MPQSAVSRGKIKALETVKQQFIELLDSSN